MYEGGIMTAFSRHVAHWDTTGYGALLMTASSHPGQCAHALLVRRSCSTRGAPTVVLLVGMLLEAVVLGCRLPAL